MTIQPILKRIIPLSLVGVLAASLSLILSIKAQASYQQMFQRGNSNFCLNAYRPGRGTNVNLWDCDPNDPDQRWERIPLTMSNNYRWMIRRVGTNFCLNAYRPGRGTNVNLWDCNPNDLDQHWEDRGLGEVNRQLLQRTGSNFCLNAYRPGRGTNVNLWDCNDEDFDQHWSNRSNLGDIAAGNINLPFRSGQTWYVCQGYQGPISHRNSYGLDLTISNRDFGSRACWARDGNVNKSAGQSVLAPTAGTVTYVGADLICLTASDNRRSFLIGHINRTVRSGTAVNADAQLGTVSRASRVNGGFAHIHIEARNGPGCPIGRSIPFTVANGFQFVGVGDLPDLQGSPDYHRRALTRP